MKVERVSSWATMALTRVRGDGGLSPLMVCERR